MFQRDLTGGILLRQFRHADAEALLAAVERNREYLREWLPWVDTTHGPEDLHRFIESSLDQYRDGLGPSCGIWLEGELIGSIGFHPFNRPDRSCSLGYWIDAARQGQGIVSRCCMSLLEYAFDQEKMHRVMIRCGTGNTRSSAIPSRLGLTLEGVTRDGQFVAGRFIDLEVWSMLEEEWRVHPPSVPAR